MSYDYYLDESAPVHVLRRYLPGCESGERYRPVMRKWTEHCAGRSECIQTGDTRLTAPEAEELFPGSTTAPEEKGAA